jgi:hypothetical protein
MVWVGLLEEFLDVVCRWLRLMLAASSGGHDTHDVRAARFPIVVVVVVGCRRSPLRKLLVPPLPTLSTLPGALDCDVRRCLPATTWSHLPVSWMKMKFGRLAVAGVPGSSTAKLLGGVPENVIVFVLAWVLCVSFRSRTHIPLASLSMSLGLGVPPPSPHGCLGQEVSW